LTPKRGREQSAGGYSFQLNLLNVIQVDDDQGRWN